MEIVFGDLFFNKASFRIYIENADEANPDLDNGNYYLFLNNNYREHSHHISFFLHILE